MANFQSNKLPVSLTVGVNDNPQTDSAQGINGTKMILDFNTFVDVVENEFNNNVSTKLTANRTYYVSTTGNDSNTGLIVGSPFLTINKALSIVENLDFNGYNVIIQLADGIYNEEISLSGLKSPTKWITQGEYRNILTINGNATTPGNVSIQAPYGDGTGSGIIEFKNLKIVASQYGGVFNANRNLLLVFKDIEIDMGNTGVTSFLTYRNSTIELGDRLTVNSKIKFIGSCEIGIDAYENSLFMINPNTEIEFSSTTFNSRFLSVAENSVIKIGSGCTFTNTFTGKSFLAVQAENGLIKNQSGIDLDTLGTVNGTYS